MVWLLSCEPSACVLTAYPLGLVYDPNMIWKTEPAPQPSENLIQEQACMLVGVYVFSPSLKTSESTVG
jgi:hypothetical protein